MLINSNLFLGRFFPSSPGASRNVPQHCSVRKAPFCFLPPKHPTWSQTPTPAIFFQPVAHMIWSGGRCGILAGTCACSICLLRPCLDDLYFWFPAASHTACETIPLEFSKGRNLLLNHCFTHSFALMDSCNNLGTKGP